VGLIKTRDKRYFVHIDNKKAALPGNLDTKCVSRSTAKSYFIFHVKSFTSR
jgi:hypothetical protein